MVSTRGRPYRQRQTHTHVNSPDTRARADVQYVSGLLYGREVKLAIKG
jgi:hypothetical protein